MPAGKISRKMWYGKDWYMWLVASVLWYGTDMCSMDYEPEEVS